MEYKLVNIRGSFDSLQKHFDLYRYFIKEGDFCIDIGSNCGSSTIPMIMLHGKAGKTISFEPNKQAFEYLRNNIEKNSLSGYCDLHNLAIANLSCQKDYISSPSADNGGFTDGFSLKERGSLVPSYKVDCVNLKSFLLSNYSFKELKKVSFIKIDCEGYDADIINSLSDFLEIFSPVILTEWWFDISKNDKLFDSIAFIDYIPYRSDNFKIAERNQFKNKCEDLILIHKSRKVHVS